MAAVIWVAQGHRLEIFRRTRRPPRTMRPAAEKSRSRSRFGSQRRAVPVRASMVVQARSSQARATISAPDLVLGVAVQGEVAQAGVLGAADPVLAPGAAAVPEFQVGELAALGAGGEAGEAVAVDVGEPQLRAGVRAFLADDDPHALRPGGQVQHAGELGDPRAVADLPVTVIGGGPGPGGDLQDGVVDVVGDGQPDRVLPGAGPAG